MDLASRRLDSTGRRSIVAPILNGYPSPTSLQGWDTGPARRQGQRMTGSGCHSLGHARVSTSREAQTAALLGPGARQHADPLKCDRRTRPTPPCRYFWGFPYRKKNRPTRFFNHQASRQDWKAERRPKVCPQPPVPAFEGRPTVSALAVPEAPEVGESAQP